MSLLDSLDLTLDNERKAQTVARTSGDMQTIPELTGERGTSTRANSEDVASFDHRAAQGNAAADGQEGGDISTRPGTAQTEYTASRNDVNDDNDDDDDDDGGGGDDDDGGGGGGDGEGGDGILSSNVSAIDTAGKTTSGLLRLCFRFHTALSL